MRLLKLLLVSFLICGVAWASPKQWEWVDVFFDVAFSSSEIDIPTIVKLESSGDPHAYNKKSGCIGLMQINPNGALADYNQQYGIVILDNHTGATHRSSSDLYNTGDLYNPRVNVKIGEWYINIRIPEMLEEFSINDTVENRLIAYHWGIGNLFKYDRGKKKLPKETKSYIAKYKREVTK